MKTRVGIALVTVVLTSLAAGCPRLEGQNTSNNNAGGGDGAGGSRFFLWSAPDVHNTREGRVKVDAQNGVHFLFPAYAGGHAFYGYCPEGCPDDNQLKVISLETDASVHNANLVLDSAGKPHVLLATMEDVYYGTCTGDCTDPSGWSLNVVVSHAGEAEASGDTFVLDPAGRPRFLMHGYRGYLGIGSRPNTWFVSCDSGCDASDGWQATQLTSEVWEEGTLRYSADGKVRFTAGTTVEGTLVGIYGQCDDACTNADNWKRVVMGPAYSNRYVESIVPSLSLELTPEGTPRIAFLAQDAEGKRALIYAACDVDCGDEVEGEWRATLLLKMDNIGPGMDLELTSSGQPRLVYTVDYNIFMAHCDGDCEPEDASTTWKLTKVEASSDMEADDVIPYWNCTVAAWFLSRPSMALAQDGLPRIVYRAEDVSGGWENPDPTRPACEAGADMVLTRYSRLAALSE